MGFFGWEGGGCFGGVTGVRRRGRCKGEGERVGGGEVGWLVSYLEKLCWRQETEKSGKRRQKEKRRWKRKWKRRWRLAKYAVCSLVIDRGEDEGADE